MGANITTFVDTLFAAVLLEHPAASAVVMAQVVGVFVVSSIVLFGFYRHYANVVHGIADGLLTERRRLGGDTGGARNHFLRCSFQ